MPIRNGKVVGWKHEVKGFKEIVNHDEMTIKEKLEGLRALLQEKRDIFNLDEDEYHEQTEEALEDWGHDDGELEFLGNEILERIYCYADCHLIWLGI